MAWKDILKQDDVITELKELIEYAEGMSSEIGPSSGPADSLNYETDQLKGKIDDKLFRDLDEQVNDIWSKSDDLSAAFDMYADTIREYLEERKQKKEEVDDESIHPDFRNYKLKDDEQWGEGPQGLLIPRPIDEMFGAEF